MSNALAIAATTATLRNLLDKQIRKLDTTLDFELTSRTPDTARKGLTKTQLNLYLYQTTANAAWRNLDMPRQVRPGEVGNPPLALNLHYLITAYPDDTEDEATSHRALGSAMSVLHDHPLLGRADIAAALESSKLAEQFERLRITPIAMPMDEASKLWTAMQTPFRLSAGYEVTVVLIDSNAASRAPLPVLTRGKGDTGPKIVPSLAPVLESLRYPHAQSAASLGDDIAIVGARLAVAGTEVRLTSPRLAAPLLLTPKAGERDGEIRIHLPSLAEDADAMSTWAPGLYTLAVVTQSGDITLASNELAFALAPQIKVSPPNAAAGTVDIAITCTPRIVADQRVSLIFGEAQFAPDATTNPPPPTDATKPSELAFTVAGAAKNPDGSNKTYIVRLRVDGVDSIPVVYGDPPVPVAFDTNQQVTIT
jgi:uncharacterized protein DUF4255